MPRHRVLVGLCALFEHGAAALPQHGQVLRKLDLGQAAGEQEPAVVGDNDHLLPAVAQQRIDPSFEAAQLARQVVATFQPCSWPY